jgi:hypothetical protein
MEVTLHIPDEIAKRLSGADGNVSRRALEAMAVPRQNHRRNNVVTAEKLVGRNFGE